jgi:hypothetical protein
MVGVMQAAATKDEASSPERTLARNLAALALRSPAAAGAISQARGGDAGQGVEQIRLLAARSGHLTGEDARHGAARLLASAVDPAGEARAWAQGVAVEGAAVVAVRGAGVWHHVVALAERMRGSGAIVVYEPDVALLRAVLSHVDIVPLLGAMPVSVVVDGEDMAQVAGALEGTEGLVATGVMIVDHPPSTARLRVLADGGERFAKNLTGAVQAVRTSVVTTLVQIETTVENLLGNLPLYVDGPGIAELAGSERGKPAVIVSAGPSLRKNIDQLAQPGVRDRVVIIAVQTVLKQLLARGIRPHYVTALDYHAISTRFYERLTSKDVEGITLVIDPKAHPAIARAFPGCVRCARSEVLDKTLGAGLVREMGEVPAGATVAHLAYYLARHLGCTTAIFVGQDLGFTDNQYYSPGAAIHSVWGNELSEVQTLENMEWQRIVRMRGLLRRVPGALGGELYADEQMHTYRVQFEREFERDVRSGMTIIDATEGGALKRHTRVQCLASALREHAARAPRATPVPPLAEAGAQSDRAARTFARLGRLQAACEGVRSACDEAATHLQVLDGLLAEARDAGELPRERCDALIAKAQAAARSTAGNEGLWLVEQLNQAGQLKRFRADRALLLAAELSPLEVQRRQVGRDLLNVRWLRDSAARATEMLERAAEELGAACGAARVGAEVGSKRARGAKAAGVRAEAELALEDAHGLSAGAASVVGKGAVWGLVHAHPERSGLGVARGWRLAGEGVGDAQGVHVLVQTVRKLLRVAGLAGVLVAVEAQHEALVRGVLREAGVGEGVGEELGTRVRVLVHEQGAALAAHRAGVRAARCLNRQSWRAGAGQLCAYDELLCPTVDATLLEQAKQELAGEGEAARTPHAVLLVGDDWCALDPALCERVVARHAENPVRHRMAFSQAPPGLCGLLVDCDLVRELAESKSSPWWRTLGGMLGYHPMKPQMDAIAKDICVAVDASVRDVVLRCTADDANFVRVMRAAEREDASALEAWDAKAWATFVAGWVGSEVMQPLPERLVPERVVINASTLDEHELPGLAHELARWCERQPALALTVRVGRGEANWAALVDAAKASGVWAVHVRCDWTMLLEEGMLDAVLGMPIDLLSVDLPGDSAQAFGDEATRERAWGVLQQWIDTTAARTPAGQLPRRWLAAHMPKTQATLGEMELFFDRWLLGCGTAVLHGQGELALPEPGFVRARGAWSTLGLGAAARAGVGAVAGARLGVGSALAGALEGAI